MGVSTLMKENYIDSKLTAFLLAQTIKTDYKYSDKSSKAE